MSRAFAWEIFVNALAGRFIEANLMASEPDDEWLNLNAESGAVGLSLYRKTVRGETFGLQVVKLAKQRWLFSRLHEA